MQATSDRQRGDSGESSIGLSPNRDPEAKNLAMDRDNNQCVLSKEDLHSLEVAYVIPKWLHGTNPEVDWLNLLCFWSNERVKEWQQAISQANLLNTEQVQNLITLSAHVHAYWDGCACAFRPIQVNENRTKMEIAFHWLPPHDDKIRREDLLPIDENPYGPGHRGFDKNPGDDNFEFDIPSGYIFTVTTDDPSRKPLPSFELLNLQWQLRRIAAMQGDAEEDDSDIDSDGDDISV